ncbi:putative gustatory receptor 28b [Neodiprion virginianus]|uniref:putative gustatory receptor 28b n=1 Tax=Neodiprion virginianus TaxID=2961670 RepID=UPI001EE6D1B7|nr:putative gustatory receptor 28b [Neodiprion virginianus]
MRLAEPKDLLSSLAPIAYFNFIVGVSLFRRTYSKNINALITLYFIGFWILCIFIYYTAMTVLVSSYFGNRSSTAAIMYQALVYTNAIVALTVPLLAMYSRKGLQEFIKRMEKLNDIFATVLGFEKNYKSLFKQQLYYILAILVVILLISISDLSWLKSDQTVWTNISIMITLHHPILVMLVTDFTFFAIVRFVWKKFKLINAALLSLTEPQINAHIGTKLIKVSQNNTISSFQGIGNAETKNASQKRYLFQTIRKSHLELSKLVVKLNTVFGLQNLISMGVSMVMITGLLYTMYSGSQIKHGVRDTIKEILPPACWCIVYILKILAVSHSCANASDEAQKSGQIIYTILGSAIDRDFQKEIQEFALQMIQNPVRFTACGFITLDYTYVQGVIGSITTYLVILIQMSDTSSVPPPASPNKAVT